jgi:hypothetical protein
MKMKTQFERGYTLEVKSWENDGDNSKTIFYTTEDKELAIALAQMCRDLFCSCNQQIGGVGNSYDREEFDRVVEYMRQNPILTKGELNLEDEDLWNICIDISYELLGGSDFYDFRVCGSVTILYSPQPVRLEKIKNILNQSGYLISNWKYKNEKEFRTSDLPEKLNFKNKK